MKNSLWSWLVFDVYIPSTLAAIARGAMITTIPLYLISLGYSSTYVGIGTAAIAIGNLILDLPAGKLAKKIGERKLMNISLILSSFAVLMIYLESYLVIFLAMLYGAGRSLWLFSRRYVISYYLEYEVRGRASALIGASERLGTFLGPSLAATILSFSSYDEVFLVCFIITLIASLLNVASSLIRVELEEKTSKQEEIKLNLSSLLSLLSMQILIQGIRSSRTILLPLVGKYLLSLKDNEVALAISLSGFLDVISSYPSGYIMDRKGRHVNALISFSIVAVGFVLLALSYDQISFFFASMIIGLGNGFGSGLLITIGGDISNKMGKEKGVSFLAFWQFIGDSGSAAFPSLIGSLAELASISILSISISAISLYIAFFAKSRLKVIV
ncbi:MAG: MFS transporter [Thermoproteota archaeon]|nr:MFS transporter [Thermoproteota archaeon]